MVKGGYLQAAQGSYMLKLVSAVEAMLNSCVGTVNFGAASIVLAFHEACLRQEQLRKEIILEGKQPTKKQRKQTVKQGKETGRGKKGRLGEAGALTDIKVECIS
ncbi:hypothetical protein H5410_047391 [Solanum commersonii]|uniref:Uncharacterized protein n=1 Tax=Solanum commersonii TaxID=4109 RepID=A0A9J5XGZ2_SOLCO|nr:hypothetical protein H5410_047391 [Solanum commersonii]